MSGNISVNCDCRTAKVGASNESQSSACSGCSFRRELWWMLQDKYLSDVTFVVGCKPKSQKIHAHKVILAVGSPVFKRMFSTKRASNSQIIQEPDIEPFMFTSLLRFIYINEVELMADSVLEILSAAQKYSVTALENRCSEFLTNNLNAASACSLLTQARLLKTPKLVKACLEKIDEHPERAFKSDNFTDIDIEALRLILKRDTSKVDELKIFEAVLRWSESECKKNNMPVNPENRKLVLEGALSLVRFPLMTLKEFLSFVYPHELLSHKESFDIINYLNSTSPPTVYDANANKVFQERKRRFDAHFPTKQISMSLFSTKRRKLDILQMFVKTVTGKTIILNFEASDTIKRVKDKIGVKDGWQCTSNMGLIWQGSNLEEERTLADYNIQKESTIRVVSRGALRRPHHCQYCLG